MDAQQFQAQLEALRAQLLAPGGNNDGFRLEDCENCVRCNFCEGCSDCYRCTHCQDCRGCTACSHCADSAGCHGCSHLTACESCHGSAYLVLCTNCSDCTYCLGCIGLTGKEFHILNVPYSRNDYFALTKALLPALQQAGD